MKQLPIEDGVLRIKSGFALKGIENVEIQKDLTLVRLGGLVFFLFWVIYWVTKALEASGDRALGYWAFAAFCGLLVFLCLSSWWAVVIHYEGVYHKVVRGKGFAYATSLKEQLLREVLKARN